MDFRLLRAFLAVASEGNYSRAAELLHISQPALSRQIKELEDYLGVTLFLRNTRQVSLTPEGIRFRLRAREIITMVDRTTEEFKHSDDELSGELFIAGGETTLAEPIGNLLLRFHQLHTGIRFHFQSGDLIDTKAYLKNGLLDFAIVLDDNDFQSLDTIPFPGEDTWGLIMSRNHRLAKKKSISKLDLIHEDLFISRQSLHNQRLTAWLGRKIRQLHIIGTYNILYNTAQLLKSGIGAALTVDRIVRCSDENGLCFVPLEPELKTRTFFAWQKDRGLSHTAESFLEFFREYYPTIEQEIMGALK